MTAENSLIRPLFVCLCILALQAQALAHGGVVEEDDLCIIKVDYLRAHFKIYQPRVTGHKQFCEDLPTASESVFVMEYGHDSLSEMSVDFRIIRDVTGKGRFARMEDVAGIEDLEAVTVYYRPPVVEPDVFTVLHEFEEEGDFIGIVSATRADTNKVYAAVFPFEVGFTGLGYWPVIIGILVLLQLQYLVMSGRLKRWLRRGTPAAVGIILFFAFAVAPLSARAEQLVVTWSTPEGPIRINHMHSWILHVRSDSGEPVTGASITVEGGMPAHDHGMPTRPRVTEDLGDGDYRLDGMRFHMGGYWEIRVTVTTNDGETVVVIPLNL